MQLHFSYYRRRRWLVAGVTITGTGIIKDTIAKTFIVMDPLKMADTVQDITAADTMTTRTTTINNRRDFEMTFIICLIIFSFLLMPLGAVINTHKTKVRRRQNREDMKEALKSDAAHDAISLKPLTEAPLPYRMYGAEKD